MTARRRRPAAEGSIIDRLSSTDPRDWMTEAELEELPSLIEAWPDSRAEIEERFGHGALLHLEFGYTDATTVIDDIVIGRRRAACREESEHRGLLRPPNPYSLAERVGLGWC